MAINDLTERLSREVYEKRAESKQAQLARRWAEAHEARERLAQEAIEAEQRRKAAVEAEDAAWQALKEAAGRSDTAAQFMPPAPFQYAGLNR